MSTILEAAPREAQGTRANARLRKTGKVPANLYGGGQENRALEFDAKAVLGMVHQGNPLIDIKLDGKDTKVLIKEVQWDTYGQNVVHLDMHLVNMSEKLQVAVTVTVKGEAKGVRDGGILEVSMHEVTVECLPDKMPEELVVDVSELGVGETITVGDLEVPAGAEFIDDPNHVVVHVSEPREEEETEPVEGEGGPAEPEVIGASDDGESGESEG
jgi:large subunit ribosomal protein L25